MATRAQAEAAAVSLRAHLAQAPWFAGATVAAMKCGGDSAHIMVSVHATPEEVLAFVDCPYTPKQWEGVRLQYIVHLDGLSGAPLSTQDYANIGLGVMVLVATFMVGKISVESAIASRREHFERKGQPPAAVQSKETTMDGLVKMGAMALSFYTMSKQFPEVLTEAQKYLR